MIQNADKAALQERQRYDATIDWLLMAVGLVVLYALPTYGISSDALERFQAIGKIVDGTATDKVTLHSLVGPLFSIPMYLMGKLIATPELWCARYNFVLFGLGLIVIYRLLAGILEAPVRRKFLLILIFGSLFAHHIRTYHGEVFTVVLAAAGMTAVAAGRHPLLGWTAMAVGVANTPATGLGLALVALAWGVRNRRIRYALAPLAAAAIIVAETWIRHGAPFATGYEVDKGYPTFMPYSGRLAFSYPLFFGLLSLLFCFGKGLLFFTPGAFLPAKRELSARPPELYTLYKLWLWFLVGTVLVYAKWWSWYGGWFWGPRYMLFACVPAALVLAVRVESRARSFLGDLLTLTALALSFWVGIAGAVYNQDILNWLRSNNYAMEPLTWYVPEYSVLWRAFVAPLNEKMPLALAPRHWAIIATGAAIFFWVGLPLLGRVMNRCIGETRTFIAQKLDLASWRF